MNEFVSSAAASFPAVATGMGNVAQNSLERRLVMILRERNPYRVPFLGAALIGLVTLPVLQGWSQAQAPESAAKAPDQSPSRKGAPMPPPRKGAPIAPPRKGAPVPPSHTPVVESGTYGGLAAEVEAVQATFNLRDKQYKRLKSLADAKAIDQDLVAEAEQKLASAVKALKAVQAEAQAVAADARVKKERAAAKVDECKKNLQAAMDRMTTAKAKVEAALTSANDRKKEYDRMQKLADEGLIDERLVAEEKERTTAARSALKAAEVSVEIAQTHVELQKALLAEAVARLRIADILSGKWSPPRAN